MGQTSWWAVLLGAVVGALIGFSGTLITSQRQNRRGRREEWFRRVQWAEELASSDREHRRTAGLRVLDELAKSDLSTTDDLALIDALRRPQELHAFADEYADVVDALDFVQDNDGDIA